MQVGLFTAATEASPRYNEGPQRIQMEDRQHPGDHREQDRHERERVENERHERELQRREQEREWRERQEQERRDKERHDREKRSIAALLIGIAIGAAAN